VRLGNQTDHQQLVIKFVASYCSDGHQLLARRGLAPDLIYSGFEDPNAEIVGGLRLIVMAYVPSVSLYNVASTKLLRLQKSAYDCIAGAVARLHEHRFVFGDLQSHNILVDESCSMPHSETRDFDWSWQASRIRIPSVTEYRSTVATWRCSRRIDGHGA
jgi:serine/threonine protein kinase